MLYGIVEFLGWFGAVTVLAGYILFSTGKLPNGPVYQLFNLVGGLSVAVNVAAHHAIPSTIVNGVWAIVAVVVLVKMAKARRAAQRGAPVAEPVLPHAEPATTTAVLPIVGPALRDHEPEKTDHAATAPYPTAAAPMTESIPVITATIALALVAAAQEQADRGAERRDQEQADAETEHAATAEHADRGTAGRATAEHTDRATAQHADTTPATPPHRAGSTRA